MGKEFFFEMHYEWDTHICQDFKFDFCANVLHDINSSLSSEYEKKNQNMSAKQRDFMKFNSGVKKEFQD